MIKAVFLDIDGTLLSNTTGQIPKSAGEAIDEYENEWSQGLYGHRQTYVRDQRSAGR